MANTPNHGIFYPDGANQLTPIQTPFANLASSVDAALTTLQGEIPNQGVSSAAERDALFPAPAQGDTVYRNDKGWTERYYNLYNASTNPGGAYAAGWHVIDMAPVARAVQPFTASSGWSVSGNNHGYRFGPLAYVRLTVQRTGANIVVPSSGDVGNIEVATLNSVWEAIPGPAFPVQSTITGRVLAGGIEGNRLILSAMGSGNDIMTGQNFSFGGIYVLANA